MTTGRLINCWTLIIILLVVIIAAGSIVAWSRYSSSQPVEISIVPSQELQGEIYIGGAISNSGFYPFTSEDSLEEKLGSENIYRTDEQGTIELITDGERLWVRVER